MLILLIICPRSCIDLISNIHKIRIPGLEINFMGIIPIDQLPDETQKARYAILNSFRTNYTWKFSAKAAKVLPHSPAASSDTFITSQQHIYTRLHCPYQQMLSNYYPFRKVTNSSLPHVNKHMRKVKLKQTRNGSDRHTRFH